MKSAAIVLINIYKFSLSPLFFTGACRYSPTCSEFTKEAIERQGLIKGITAGIRRLLSCR